MGYLLLQLLAAERAVLNRFCVNLRLVGKIDHDRITVGGLLVRKRREDSGTLDNDLIDIDIVIGRYAPQHVPSVLAVFTGHIGFPSIS